MKIIDVIGVRRLLVLSVLIALNAVLAAGIYMYFAPEGLEAERTLRRVTGQVSQKRAEVNQLRVEFEQIQDQKEFFGNLQATGFFTDQNRLVARRRIEDIQKKTGVLSASYNIGAGEILRSKEATEAGHVVLQSRIDLSVSAMDDIDVYNFIYWLENAFPGHITVDLLEMKRVQEVNDAALRRIGSGLPTVMVEADLSALWRTMVPREAIRGTPQTISGEF